MDIVIGTKYIFKYKKKQNFGGFAVWWVVNVLWYGAQ